jgi:pimeloyl-ACP methyl ester carboxylesterase
MTMFSERPVAKQTPVQPQKPDKNSTADTAEHKGTDNAAKQTAASSTENTPFGNERHLQDPSIMGRDYYALSEARNKHRELAGVYQERIAELRKELWRTDFSQMAAKQAKIEHLVRKHEAVLEKVRTEDFAVQGIRPANKNNMHNPDSHRGVYTDPENEQKQIFYEQHITDPALPTLICIPGVGADGSMFHSAMNEISGVANCIIFDRLNQGYSSHSDQVVGFEQQVSDLTSAVEYALDQAGITNYQLVGHSYGGNIARRISDNMALAGKKPAKIVSISSAQSYGFGSKKQENTPEVTKFAPPDHPRGLLSRLSQNSLITYLKNRRKMNGPARQKNELAEQKIARQTHLRAGGLSAVPHEFISADMDFLVPTEGPRGVRDLARNHRAGLHIAKNAAHSGLVTSPMGMALTLLRACDLDKHPQGEAGEAADIPLVSHLEQKTQVKQYLDDGNPRATPVQRTLLDAYYKAGNFGTRALAWLRNTLKV